MEVEKINVREREREEEEMATYFHVRLGMNTAMVQQLLSYFRSVCQFKLSACDHIKEEYI